MSRHIYKNILRAILNRGIVEYAIITICAVSIVLTLFYKVHGPYEAFFLMLFGTLTVLIILEVVGKIFTKFE